MKKLLLAVLLLATPAYAQVVMTRPAGTPVEYDFTSRNTTPVPTSISGGAVACKKGSVSTTSTAGVTFTANLGGVTGANHLTVDLSADTAFYSANSQIGCLFTAGTVGGNSIVGEFVLEFYISSDFTIRKNVAFPNFPVWMRSANGSAVPGIAVTCQHQNDAAAFASFAGSITEVANGKYLLNITAAELNANAWSILCTGPGAVPYIRDVTPQQ